MPISSELNCTPRTKELVDAVIDSGFTALLDCLDLGGGGGTLGISGWGCVAGTLEP